MNGQLKPAVEVIGKRQHLQTRSGGSLDDLLAQASVHTASVRLPHRFRRDRANPAAAWRPRLARFIVVIETLTADQYDELVERAQENDYGQWENELARYNVHLCVEKITARDRRALESEARMGVRAARKFWEKIPAEDREQLRVDAGLKQRAIPEDLRVPAAS